MQQNWFSWILAVRPKTLTQGIVPVVVATALAARTGHISWELSLYAALAAIFITIGTNLINDALDFKRKADTHERLGPVRVTQAGLLSGEQVLTGGMMAFGAALLFSIPLILKGGWPMAAIMCTAPVLGYLYTGGPKPLAYIGLGEVFVFVFYGLVAVNAVFYLQTGFCNLHSVVAGAQIGLLSTNVLSLNNLRDIFQDEKANKRTLPVRFGVLFGRMEITLLMLIAFAVNLFWWSQSYYAAAILPTLSLPLAFIILRGIWNHEPGKIYNEFFAFSGLLHLAFGLFLSIGLMP